MDWTDLSLDEAIRVDLASTRPSTPKQLPDWRPMKRRVLRSVFQTDISQPTPTATPVVGFPVAGQPFGGFGTTTAAAGTFASEDLELPDAEGEEGQGGLPRGPPPHPGYGPGEAGEDQVRFDRAWHVVTMRIALPSSVAAEDSFGTLAPASQADDQAAEIAFQQALRLVLYARAGALPKALHTEDILAWHTNQVRRHYAQHVVPMLSACASGPVPERGRRGGHRDEKYYKHHMKVVLNTVRTLEAALRQYMHGLELITRGLPPGSGKGEKRRRRRSSKTGTTTTTPQIPEADEVIAQFRQDFFALVANSTPALLMHSMRMFFTLLSSVLLDVPDTPCPPSFLAQYEAREGGLRAYLHEVLTALADVGLAGESFQVLFGEIMYGLMVKYVRLTFQKRWSMAATVSTSLSSSTSASASSYMTQLLQWVEERFARLAHEVFVVVGRRGRDVVQLDDVQTRKDMAVQRLSELRMIELFDIVLHWPSSRGGLDDLRMSVTTPQRRARLVASFTSTMRRRLLQPHCSTLQILQTYIAMIHAFHALDPSNVLLSAAVAPLQMYLCQRDDAVRLVVDGLLADVTSEDMANVRTLSLAERVASSEASSETNKSSEPKKLIELAAILNDPQQQRRRHADEEALDWNDMAWVPDPIDAGTNYRRPKSEDVIGTLIEALGSREAFTKEFQHIIAERLLSASSSSSSSSSSTSQTTATDRHFVKETQVLVLLQKRFGEAALQSCEVMIRDVQDSAQLNWAIHGEMALQKRLSSTGPTSTSPTSEVPYDAKILSRLYWPGLSREPFRLPPPIEAVQKRYEAGYAARKAGRKLAWLDQLGQAKVQLELADRTVAVDCKTYEAAVIYAFGDEEGEKEEEEKKEQKTKKTAMDLVEQLHMDEDLVEAALQFWHAQGVLRKDPSDPEAFVVVENEHPSGDEAMEAMDTTAAAAATTTTAPAKRKPRADDPQRTVYWQFVKGMLTNSAASMPVAQIAMMMRMLISEGFPWSDEELQEFLGEKVSDGELEVAGGKYRLVKK